MDDGRSVFLAAVWTQDVVVAVRQEAAPKQHRPALVAHETVGVPLTTLKRDKLGTVDSGNRFVARRAFLRKQLSVALDAVGLIGDRRETLAAENSLAVRTAETVPVPRAVVVDDSTLADCQAAFDARFAVRVFVARHADDVGASRYESVTSDRLLTLFTDETVGVPLTTSVFVLLHSWTKDVAAANTPWREVAFIASGAVELVVLERERFVN